MSHTYVIGGNFSGITAALELKRKVGKEHKVTVISKSPVFLFIPSLIWVPFGEREIKDITTPIEPILSKHDIEFIQAEATQILQEENLIKTTKGDFSYDYLVMATGPELAFDAVEGIGPESNVSCICNPKGAMDTREKWEEFKKNPGPVVIGAAPAAGCAGAAYEFLFNFEKRCREAGIRDKVDITWVTPEPFVGHFGIEGIAGGEALLKGFMKALKIKYVENVAIEKVENNEVHLSDGQKLPYEFSMIMPAFTGAKVVLDSPGLGNEKGFIPVHDTYQHHDYKNVFAVGIASHYPIPFKTDIPLGMPKTGYPADESGKAAAENIARLINGKTELKEKAMGKIPGLCIMDAGRKEVIILSNSLLKPRKFAIMIPNPFYDVNKILFEKYFLWKTKKGYSFLP